MNLAQRVIVSLALAGVLGVVAHTVSDLVLDEVSGGWFMYQPESTPLISSPGSDGDSLRVAAVWLVAIALWFGISWRLFRTTSE